MRCVRQLLLLAITMIAVLSHAANAKISPLTVIDQELRTNFPDVESIKASELQTVLGGKERPVILDVREPEEFAVSHIQGAVRIDPDAELNDVLLAIGTNLKGRPVIVYCSVGVRSTQLAERVHKGLKFRGASRVANLSEGIFGWHNAKRSLVRDTQASAYVHPYDALWGLLLRRQDLTAYAPVLQGKRQTAGAGSNEKTLNLLLFLGLFSVFAVALALPSRNLC